MGKSSSSSQPVPEKLSGKQFERLILRRAKSDERANRYTMGRYGVMSSFNGKTWRPLLSLPDFEGILPCKYEDDRMYGNQFIFDAKTCSQASYPLSGGTHKSFAHQYTHMKRRAKFGCICFILIHFNARQTKKTYTPPETYAIPIDAESTLWKGYEAGNVKSISRYMGMMFGILVDWNIVNSRARCNTPDIYSVLLKLFNQ